MADPTDDNRNQARELAMGAVFLGDKSERKRRQAAHIEQIAQALADARADGRRDGIRESIELYVPDGNPHVWCTKIIALFDDKKETTT